MTARSSIAAAIGALLLCGCAPKLRVTVPEGWKVTQDVSESKARAEILTHEATGVAIQVACDKADESTLPMLAAQVLGLVANVEGQVTEFEAAKDGSSFGISFTAEREGVGTLRGRMVAKFIKQKGMAVATTGIWKDDQDKAVSPGFDQIAASADFR